MSTIRYNRKPPLAKSPIRPRSSRVLRSNSASLQTPPGSLTKSHKPVRSLTGEESHIRPEYMTISSELRALSKMVQSEVGTEKTDFITTSLGANSTPLFERGKFYDEYSARRNERLKRRNIVTETEIEPKSGHRVGLGVTNKTSKKKDTKKLESLRKSMSAAYSVERNESQIPRYSLRSMSKATEHKSKRPPLAVSNYNLSMSAIGTEKKSTGRRVGRRV